MANRTSATQAVVGVHENHPALIRQHRKTSNHGHKSQALPAGWIGEGLVCAARALPAGRIGEGLVCAARASCWSPAAWGWTLACVGGPLGDDCAVQLRSSARLGPSGQKTVGAHQLPARLLTPRGAAAARLVRVAGRIPATRSKLPGSNTRSCRTTFTCMFGMGYIETGCGWHSKCPGQVPGADGVCSPEPSLQTPAAELTPVLSHAPGRM